MPELPQAENEWEWRPVVPLDTEAEVSLTAEEWGLLLKAMDVGYQGLAAEERDRFAGVSEGISAQLCEPLFLESWNDGYYLPGHPEYEKQEAELAAESARRDEEWHARREGRATELSTCEECAAAAGLKIGQAPLRGVVRQEVDVANGTGPFVRHLSCGHISRRYV